MTFGGLGTSEDGGRGTHSWRSSRLWPSAAPSGELGSLSSTFANKRALAATLQAPATRAASRHSFINNLARVANTGISDVTARILTDCQRRPRLNSRALTSSVAARPAFASALARSI